MTKTVNTEFNSLDHAHKTPIVRDRGVPTPLDSASSNSKNQKSLAVDCIGFCDLSQEDLETWDRLRAARYEFSTPFFSTTFIAAVDASRGDVEVARIRRGREVIGFLPFHRRAKIAWPAGRCFNDAHNIIAKKEDTIDWHWLLNELHLKAFHFHAMLGSGDELSAQDCFTTIRTFSLPLGDDSSEALVRLETSHKTLRKQEQKTRKMEREIGPLTLEMDCRDIEVMIQAVETKREQYRRTGLIDLFEPEWTRKMLMFLFEEPRDGVHGMLSVLRAGDHVVAAHFGHREGDLLHYWFPVYSPAYSLYSPGTALFKSIVNNATEHGIRTIDMGYGEQPYKLKQTDTFGEVQYGVVSNSTVHQKWMQMKHHASLFAKKIPYKTQVKKIVRAIAPNVGKSKIT